MHVEKSRNQRSEEKPVEFVFCVDLSPYPPQSHFGSPLCLSVCVCVLEEFNSVEASSNVSLPVEMAAVCSIVVIDWCGVGKDGLLCTWR